MPNALRKLYSYGAVVALYALVFGWWLFFFANQSEFLIERVAARGISIEPAVAGALRSATQETMRMFIFEGAFLGLLLLGSMMLVVRALQRELQVNRQQRNFLSAVTHELKTPIASAKLYLESLLLGRAEGEKHERYLKHAHQDLDRLHSMVESLLQTARMQSRAVPIEHAELEVNLEIERILQRLRNEAPTASVACEFTAGTPAHILADREALTTMLRNLLANAAKYGGKEPRVSVSILRDGAHIIVRVRDFGPGLQAADPKRIFDAFVRGGDEEVRTRPGVGLGLYLVAELARAQGAVAKARTDLDGGGFGVDLCFPVVKTGA